jgi:hypothetical protein
VSCSRRMTRLATGACVWSAGHGPDKRLDRRKTLQISANVAGPHSDIFVCDSDCGGPFLTPAVIGHAAAFFEPRRLRLVEAIGHPPFRPCDGARTQAGGLAAAPGARQTDRVARCPLTVADSCL